MNDTFDELAKGVTPSARWRGSRPRSQCCGIKTKNCSGPLFDGRHWVAALAAAAISWPLAGPAATPAQQAYLKASNTGALNYFGASVAVSGDTVVIGATRESSGATNSGAAYVFVRSGSNWSQQAYLKSANTEDSGLFGISVAVSGDSLVIGASEQGYGAAYVFVRDRTNWSQQAYLKAANAEYLDSFGTAVAVSGDTVVVGGWGESSNATGVNGDGSDNSQPDSGAAYVFVRNGTNWSQQAYLKASNTQGFDQFGSSVAVSGDTVVVGSPGEDSSSTGVNGNQSDESGAAQSGAAYIFVRSGTNWSQQAYLKASNTDAGDEFGCSVAVSGDTVVVGAWGESSSATGVDGDQSDNSAPQSGAAYVFVRRGTTWSQQACLKASNTGSNDQFGIHSVATSGDVVVVGAFGEASNATGVNGSQNDNSADRAGAAYVFVRSGTTWNQQAYLKPSNTDALDYFGESLAASGDTVVIAAVGEASNATGVNGNQSDNSAPNSGAAYVFTGLGIGPRLALAPDGSGGYLIRFNCAPDVTCRLERVLDLTGLWDTIDAQTAPASGLLEFREINPPAGGAFYRAAQP